MPELSFSVKDGGMALLFGNHRVTQTLGVCLNLCPVVLLLSSLLRLPEKSQSYFCRLPVPCRAPSWSEFTSEASFLPREGAEDPSQALTS